MNGENRNISEEEGLLKFKEVFTSLSQKSVNYSWAKTGIKKFQTQNVLDPELNPEFLRDIHNLRLEEQEIALGDSLNDD